MSQSAAAGELPINNRSPRISSNEIEIPGVLERLTKLRKQRVAEGPRKLRNLTFSSNKVSKFAEKAVNSDPELRVRFTVRKAL